MKRYLPAKKRHPGKKRHLPVKTALVGLLITPVAFSQEAAAQQSPAPADPTPPPTTKPAGTSQAPVTMQTTTVTGARPSEDFAPPAPSLNRLGNDVHDIPQSIVIINKPLMQSQGVTSLQSAVRNVPGVTLGAAEGGSIGNNIYLNGFNARTDLYIDGMRDPAQYYRDTFAIEQIEVLMGPSSMLFGRGSTGGVINQVLKKPNLTKSTDLSVSGSTNAYGRATADINYPTGESSAARVNLMFQDGSVSTRQQTQVQDFGIAPSYKFGIGTPTEVTLYGLLQYNHDHVDYGLPPLNRYPANVSPNLAYGFPSDRTDQFIAMAGANIEHKFNPNLKLRSQTQFNYVNTNVIETAPQSVGTVSANGTFTALTGSNPYGASYNLFVRQQSHDRIIDDLTLNNQTEIEAKFKTASIGHTLLAGFDLGYESYRNQAYSRTGTCNGAPLPTGYVGCTSLTAPSGNGPLLPETAGNLAMGYAYAFGAYANDTIELIPEVKLVGGLRYDVYYSQIGNSINSANTRGSTAVPYFAQTDTFLSYRAGLIFQPTKQQTYYVSTSTSFNPSLEQLTSTTGGQSLPPQNNTAYEAGVKYDLFKETLSLTAAVFQITQNNARTNNGDGTFSSAGTIRVRGVRTGIAGHITDEWQVFGGYTYLDARIIDGIGAGTQGMIPQNTPTDSAAVWTTYTFAKKYEIGGGVTYTGVRFANNTNVTAVPAGYHLDATAAYKMEKSTLRLNLFNLTNSLYYEQAMASDGGRTVPYTGFTAMLTYSARL
ncbi:MAG: TonB-dependent receptor [Proteobacteria bacterium]|nr:TonB-dependent receptor [Pseudomonadota bacterium]